MSRYVAVGGKLRRVNGWRRPTSPSPHPVLAAADTPAIVSIPTTLRPTMQDQGQIGDCVFQALRELVTGLALRQGLGEILYSALAPYWWGRQIDGTAPTDDAGSTVSTGMTVAARFGLPHLAAWDDAKPFSLEPDVNAIADARLHKALLAFSLPNVATIKASIRDGFAVELGFDCPKSLFSSKTITTGDVELPDDPSQFDGSGHAVSVWAADDEHVIGSHKGAFLCNFHWGRDVGLDGYFHLPYEYVTSGRATDAHTIRLAEAT